MRRELVLVLTITVAETAIAMRIQMSSSLVLERATDLADILVKVPTDLPTAPPTRGPLNDENPDEKNEEKRLTPTFHPPAPEHARVAALQPPVGAPGPPRLGIEETYFPTA